MTEPRLIKEGQLILVGFSFFGDPFRSNAGWTEENEIGRAWQRFMAYLAQHRPQIKHVKTDAVFYEVHIEHQETQRTGEFEVLVGLQVNELQDVPVELTIKILPAATYAVFTLAGPEITSDWSKSIGDWMAREGYVRPFPYGFQRYDERFKGVDRIDESILEIHVPVTR